MADVTEGYYEVSAQWMKACGYGEEAKAFPVIRTYMAGHLPFVVVRLDNGRAWDLCAEWRGKFI